MTLRLRWPREEVENSLTNTQQERLSPASGNALTRLLGFMTAGDAAILGIVITGALVLFFVLPTQVLSSGTMVEIRSSDRLVGRFALDRDRVVEVPGPLGTTVVKITKGRARIVSSPCPKHICTHTKDIGREGGLIACVPNEVVVHVSNEREEGLDGVTR